MLKESKEKISNDFARDFVKTDGVMFGDFILKNGEKSNIFFDFGKICNGSDIKMVGQYFATYLVNNFIPNNIDAIFGPAYKGINVAIATSIALDRYNINIPFVYNRKDKKDHGECGSFVGYDLNKVKTVLIVDDVITDGGTKYEMVDMLSQFKNLSIEGMIVGIDRQEKNDEGEPFKTILENNTGIEIHAITNKETVLKFRKT